MERNSHDIAIAGAGLTGQLMALALAEEGFSIALIDPSGGKGPSSDSRTTALAYACVRLYQRLGLWEALASKAAPIKDILVSNGRPGDRFRKGGVGGGSLHFPSSLLPDDRMGPDGEALGYIVRNTDLHAVMGEAVARHPEIEMIAAGTQAPADTKGHVDLPLSNGEAVRAQILIACDGKFSSLRDRLGYRTQRWSYGQKALAFNIRHTRPHNNVAHEIFYPQGPFALLPLPGDETSIVWTEKDPGPEHYLAMEKDAFLEALYARIGPLLGEIELSSEPVAFPLSFVYVNEPVRGRVALAGDAYHGVHPIAGQGFNLGIKDIAVLADVLSEARAYGLDIGAPDVLARYGQWRRFDAAALSFGMDGMTRLFSNDIAPIRWARGLGLGIVQKIDPARIFFMRQAGADTGDLPRLMQPF